ncbi:hypothetical protein Tco_1356701 [Tanacetum coccineum]
MGDEDLNFIPNKELDKEDLIPIPRESKIGKECDFPLCDDFQSFKTFSNPLFEKKDDFPSRNDESILKEEVHKETLKSYSNPLFEDDEEIISIEVSRQISPKVNFEPSIESPISSSPSLSSSEASEYSLDEFADELALIDFSSYPERDDMTPDDVIEFLLYGDPTSDPTESKVEEFINENTPDMSKEFVLDDMSFSPKELNLESLPKDDFDNDDDLFEMDSNNDEWKRILYGEDFEKMDFDSDKTKDFDKSSSNVFKSLSDEFEPGGSSYVEGNDLVCNEDKVFNPGILVDKNSKVHEPNVLPTLPTRSSEMMLDFDLENFQVEPKNDILNPKVLVFDPGIFDNVLTRKSSLTLKIFDPPSIVPPFIRTNSLVWGRIRPSEFLHPHFYPP